MDTRPEKMTEQEELLELQMRAAKKAKVFDILTIVTLLAIIYIFAALLFILPDRQFSEQENRMLQQFPVISSDRIFNGIFTEEISRYYSDQFPFRDYFTGIKGAIEIGLLKRENNGVILAKDNYLIPRENELNFDILKENMDSAAIFAEAMRTMDVPFNIAVAGRTFDTLQSYLPPSFPVGTTDNIWNYMQVLNEFSPQLKYINLLKPLQARIETSNDALYYRTDHHWTTLGAYYAYVEIMKNFREEPLPLSSFKRDTATGSFYGTTWSKAGMKWVEPDKIEYFRYDGDEDYITEIADTGKTFDGFYDTSYLELKDKYSSFISGNNARVNITKKDGENRPRLLVIKDSFAHSMIPFLAYHYDIVVLDMRYYTESAAKLVFDENIDRVLILNNIDNLMGTNLYGILDYGIETTVEKYIKSQFPIKNIYINGNPIEDYKVICPDIAEYVTAAELLVSTISEKTGLEIEIVKTEDFASFDKAIILSNTGLDISGLIEIAVENDNLVFKCTTKSGIEGVVNLFISEYLRKAEGSFNFGADYRYSDMENSLLMVMPE